MIGSRRLWIAAVLAVVILGGLWWGRRPPPVDLPPAVHLELGIPPDYRVVDLAMAPDGTRLAFTAYPRATAGPPLIYLRSMDAFEVEPLPGTVNAHRPFFAPDGRAIAYFADGWLRTVSLETGAVADVTEVPPGAAGGTWHEDGRIVFAPLDGRGLVAIDVAGGSVEALTALDEAAGEVAHGWPQALPGGGLVYTVARRGREPRLTLRPPGGGEPVELLPAQGGAQYVASGHLIYAFAGRVMAVGVDLSRFEADAVPVDQGLDVSGSGRGFDGLGVAAVSASRTGTLVYRPGTQADPPSQLVWVDRQGAPREVSGQAARHQVPRLSPDGTAIAVAVREGTFGRQLWRVDLATGGRERLTAEGSENHSPVWSPDGRRLAFASNREGPQNILVRTLADSDDGRLLLEGQGTQNPGSWGARGLAFYEVTDAGRDIWLLDESGSAQPFVVTAANERSPAWSPDGRWLAYVSDTSGTDEIYVTDAPGEERRVSVAGGTEPAWARHGRELYYRAGSRLMAIPVEGADFGTPVSLFDRDYLRDLGGQVANYDVAPDGRFLMLRRADVSTDLRVVLGWRALAPSSP